jgi:hypothetical protein
MGEALNCGIGVELLEKIKASVRFPITIQHGNGQMSFKLDKIMTGFLGFKNWVDEGYKFDPIFYNGTKLNKEDLILFWEGYNEMCKNYENSEQ